MDNREAAKAVFAVASLLESQGANPYRVRAYRRAAAGMLLLPADANRYADTRGELQLPWLGARLRRKLGELVLQGHMQFYDDLIASLPAALRELLRVPGIGPKTADRLSRELGLKSVPDVAHAARDGRLRQLRGIGAARERQLGAAAESLLAAAA